MTDWSSSESMLKAGKALRYLIAALWGVVGWEYIVTFDLEFNLLTRKKKFTLPMISYLLSRYLTLCSLALSARFLWSSDPSNAPHCAAYILASLLLGELGVVASTSIFLIRALALCSWDPAFTVGLGVAIMAQLAMAVWSATVLSTTFAPSWGCFVYETPPTFAAACWAGAMVDISIGVVIIYQICKISAPASSPGPTARVLLEDSLIFLFASTLCHLGDGIVIALQLNSVVSLVPAALALAIPSMLACRAFRRLNRGTKSLTSPLMPYRNARKSHGARMEPTKAKHTTRATTSSDFTDSAQPTYIIGPFTSSADLESLVHPGRSLDDSVETLNEFNSREFKPKHRSRPVSWSPGAQAGPNVNRPTGTQNKEHKS